MSFLKNNNKTKFWSVYTVLVYAFLVLLVIKHILSDKRIPKARKSKFCYLKLLIKELGMNRNTE